MSPVKNTIIWCLIVFLVGQYAWKYLRRERGDAFPNRAIKVVVPFSPGGGSDTLARDIQRGIKEGKLSPHPFVIYNRPGGSATIGSRYVKDTKPDGYTILFLHDAIITAKYSGKVNYGPDEFEPIAATGEIGLVIAVAESSRFQSLNDLLYEAKAKPNTVVNGVNMGAPSHFASLRLEHAFPGAKFRFTQAGDGTDRVQKMVGDHIQVAAFSTTEYLNFRPQGIRALCYLGPTRHPAIPEVPTAIEQGVDAEEINMQYWWAPKGTPQKAIDYIAGVLEKALQTDHVKEAFGKRKINHRFLTGEAFKQHIASRMKKTSELGQQKYPPIPNVPMVVLVLLVAALIAIVIDSRKKHREQLANVETTDANGTETPNEDAVSHRPSIGLIGLVTAIYVVLMQFGLLPFVWSTLAFIITTGFILSSDPRSDRVPLIQTAFLVAFGVNFLLTEVVVTDLP